MRATAIIAFLAFAIAFFSVPGSAQASCVYGETDNNRHYIVNGCSKSIMASFRGSNGWTGATGHVSPGRRAALSVSSQYSLRFSWCYVSDWNAGRCSLKSY